MKGSSGVQHAADDESSAALSSEPQTLHFQTLPLETLPLETLPLETLPLETLPLETQWRTLVAGDHRRPTIDAPIRLRRIVLQIVAAITIVVGLVAVTGALVSRRTAESEAVHEAATLADVLASSVVQPALTAQNGTDPSTVPAAVDRVVRTHVLSPTVVRVKLWTPEGQIAYSDESRLIGRTYVLDAGARAVLSEPQTRAEVSDLSKPENVFERSQGKLLEVYRPVWTPTGKPLLFEAYFRYDVVSDRSAQLWRGFAGIMLSSVLAIFALLLPLLWALVSRARRAQAQREEMMQRALDASQEERRRIAAGLHDGVVQQLAAASFEVGGGAEVAQSRGDFELAGRLRSAAARVRTGIAGLRSLLVDIYPPTLHDAGLAPALREMAVTIIGTKSELELAVDDAAADALTAEQKEAFFRIAQECLRNAVQHADADRITVALARAGDLIVMDVGDDGVGFADPEMTQSPTGHLGLNVIRDIAAQIGATLKLGMTPPGGAGSRRGTTWRLEVPA